MTPEVEFWGTPIFFTKFYFSAQLELQPSKAAKKAPHLNHPDLLPLLQQCSGNGTSIPLNSSTVVAVEILLPEHCCSYGSKPGWFWASFWLFLTVKNQAGPKKIFFVKKGAYGGPQLWQLKYRCQSTAAAANFGGLW